MSAALFYVFAGLLLGSALFVVLNRNPMYSIVALVFAFTNLAGMYFLLEAYFIGVLQVLVYAGAIMVLFLFVVMLLNVQPDQPKLGVVPLERWWYGVLVILFVVLLLILVGRGTQGALPAAGDAASSIGSVRAIGEALFTKSLLPFEIAGLMLTVALVGTVCVARRTT